MKLTKTGLAVVGAFALALAGGGALAQDAASTGGSQSRLQQAGASNCANSTDSMSSTHTGGTTASTTGNTAGSRTGNRTGNTSGSGMAGANGPSVDCNRNSMRGTQKGRTGDMRGGKDNTSSGH
jgi:hypothetical protein